MADRQRESDLNLDWLISVDDHVLEPGHVWQSRVPAKYRGTAPRLVTDDSGEYWLYEDRRVSTPGLSAVAGKSREEFSPDPVTYAEMRPGCYDPAARIEDMNRAGILASMCFPSFPRFCGQIFHESKDKKLALLCVRAYNDWMIDEWCGSAPGRFLPLVLIPLWDPPAAAEEIARCAGKGARALAFSENPVRLGLPSIHNQSRYWDPVWSAAQEASMVICMHQGSSSHRFQMSDDAPYLSTMAWGVGCVTSGTMLDWLFSSVFIRFPGIKICLSEGGIGWMPYFLERAEEVLDKQSGWASEGQRPVVNGQVIPSGPTGPPPEVDPRTLDVRATFTDHVFGCFIEDRAGLRNIDLIGVDNVMIETDYPHTASTWPHCIEFAHRQLSGFSEDSKYKILRSNAESLFQFTPADPPDRV